MSSFAYDSDGTDLHLLPDEVETNRVRVSLSHFSGAGTAAWTGAGRHHMASRAPKSPVKRVEHALATEEAEQHQAQRDGQPDPGSPERYLKIYDDVLRDFVQRTVAEGAEDCSIARKLSMQLRIGEDFLRKYGINRPSSPFIDQIRHDGTAAAWICDCVRGALEYCRIGEFPAAHFRFLRAEEIRSQLGVGIDQLKACLPMRIQGRDTSLLTSTPRRCPSTSTEAPDGQGPPRFKWSARPVKERRHLIAQNSRLRALPTTGQWPILASRVLKLTCERLPQDCQRPWRQNRELRACDCPGPWCISITVSLDVSRLDCPAWA